jgi:hypothetical protein
MQEIVILEAGRQERHYWLDLWRYRELFRVLAARDLSVRYKQTVIGVAWALIRPILSMVVFTVIFGHLAQLPSDGMAPYALMVFAGMLPWTFFSTALSGASHQQGLLSEDDRAHRHGGRGIRRLSHQLLHPDRAARVVLLPAELAYTIPARVRHAYLSRQHRALPLDHRSQRAVSRLSVHHSVHRAVRLVRLAGRFQLERGT